MTMTATVASVALIATFGLVKMIEPCCQDCFWETKPNNTDYTQGFRNGITYAQQALREVLFWAEVNTPMTPDVIIKELERVLRVEP